MLVILDTTETYDRLTLDTPDFRLLQSFLSTSPATLVVPEIVIQETVNHYREQLANAVASANKSIRTLNKLLLGTPEIALPNVDLDAVANAYRERLGARLKALFAKQPGYDDIRPSLLVERALQRRKPFDGQGKFGFRDAVLWESILGLLRAHPDRAVIITGNTNDFGPHGELAQHLRDDLKAVGLDEDLVCVCAGLGKFVDEHVKPHLEKITEIKQLLQQGSYKGFDPWQFFSDSRDDIAWELRKHVEGCDLDQVTRDCVGTFSDPALLELTDTATDSAEIADVWSVNDAEVAVAIDFSVEGKIECMEEMSYDPRQRPWDEPFEGDVTFRLGMTVMLQRATGEVTTWELNEVEIEPGWGWPYRDDD